MKKLKIIFSVMLILLFSQCGQTNKSKTSNQTDNKELISFDNFFKKFSEDKDFQIAHIAFPITYYISDIEDNLSTVTIQKSEWGFIDFITEDEKAKHRKTDAYRGVIERLSSDKVMYIRRGIDNGIRIEYYFHLEGSTWKMVKVEDKST